MYVYVYVSCVVLCVCVESVCGMCVLCFGVVVYCCVCCVYGAAWHAEKPRVRSKRLRVSVQNASACAGQKRACVARFAGTHGSVFEPTHGDVLNLHTGKREGGGRSLLSLVPFSLPSFSPFVHFLFLVSFSLLFSFSNNENDHSSSRFSLCTHGSDLPGRTCSHHARNNCPG